MQNNKLVTN